MAAGTDAPAGTGGGGKGGARRLARDALLIAVVTIAARFVGFGRVVTFARTVGPTCVGDVYTTANTIPNIVFDVVAGGALSGLVVPVLAGRLDSGDLAGARRVVGALLGWTLLLLTPLAVLGGLLAHPLMSLLVGSGHAGCDRGREVALGGDMLRVFAPQVVLYGLGIVAAGVLQARRRFAAPAMAPLLSSLVVIATYLGYDAIGSSSALSTSLHSDTFLLAGGTTLGVVILSLPLLPRALAELRPRPTLRFPPGVARSAGRLALAGAAVLGSQQLATGVVLRLANAHGDAGAVVAWNLGWTVFLLPWAVFAVPIATSAFPDLTVAWERGDAGGFAGTVTTTTRGLLALATGAAAAMVAAAVPAARVLVAGAPGGFPPNELAGTLVGFAPGVIGFALLTHLARVRFARGDARSPAVATAGGWAVAVLADLAAVPHVPGRWVPAALAGGASLGVTIGAGGLLAVVLHDTPVALAALRRSALTVVVAWVAAGAAGWATTRAIGASGPAAALAVTAAAIFVTALVGGGLSAVLDRDLARWAARRWRRRA